ncbi:MAG: alginate export family protein [Methyloglobulus sp.]|nr:alginate export family protein [Methyloglobulus sp.]
MSHYLNKLLPTASALSLLLSWPGLATAEDYYRKTLAYRLEPESDPPRYVMPLSKTQFEQFRDIDWLNVGLDFRTRYEYRENDLRPTPTGSTSSTDYRPDPDNLWLLRTRAYLGVHDILDPLRFAVEFEDARSYNGEYVRNESDVNEFELIQGYAELYFKDLLGHNRPLSIRAGRQALELLDRRLIGNNQFRNTTNNFEGFRVRLGKQQNDWDLDTFAFQPIERLKYEFDRADEHTWIYGGVLSLRQWSDFITIQPYFIGRKVNGDPFNKANSTAITDQDIYAPGLRVYGLIGESGFDFDADINKQFGRRGAVRDGKQVMEQHDALAYGIELGYSFDHAWKPRASIFYGFGTGDKNSKDAVNNRFDAFYGFNQPWSRNDYFSWDNIHAPKGRIEFSPYKDVKIDTAYSAYWLESETDGFRRANLRDRNGESGSFIGHEFDIRMVHKLNPYVDWSLSYARFEPGNFTRSFNNSTDGPFTDRASNFFYFEVNLNAFGDGKPTYK